MWSRLIWAAVMIKAIVTWGKARCLDLKCYPSEGTVSYFVLVLLLLLGDKSSKRTSKSKKAFWRIICNCGHVSLFASRLPVL